MNQYKRILVLAPHTDDGELGCGGSISKWIKEKREVFYIAFSAAEESVPPGFPKNALKREVMDATKVLGIPGDNLHIMQYPVRRLVDYRQEILDDMISLRKDINPDLIVLPSQNDIHQDHQVVSNEGIRAYKYHALLAYELPWNNLTFDNICFSKLSEEDIKVKYNALTCYKTQQSRTYLNENFIKGWAKMRGTQIGSDFAECFEIIRWIF